MAAELALTKEWLTDTSWSTFVTTGPLPADATLTGQDERRKWVRFPVRVPGHDALVIMVAAPVPSWFSSLPERFEHLLTLPSNWDSYGAHPFQPATIRRTLDLLFRILPDSAVPPQVVPLNNGGAQVEWHHRDIDLEISITPDGSIEATYEIGDEGPEDWEGGPSDDVGVLRDWARGLA